MKKEQIEDIYELSSMQQGMLFHTLADSNSGMYFEQLSCTLQGNLDVSKFKQAWQRVVERHPILRTAFFWEELEKPYQVVYRRVDLPWEVQDWRELSPQEQEKQLEAFLKADRERGFELSRSPLIRLTLIRIAEDAYHFVRSHHHILLEGWSWSLLWKEVYSFYEAFCHGKDLDLERPRPYRDYITWLQQQDLSKAEAFWRQQLKGFTTPTPLGINRVPGSLPSQKQECDRQRILLSATETAALQSLARQHKLTLNILLQGAWALLLSRYSREDDVVFGATSSGRSTALAGVESIVGLFINTLPLRVRVSPDAFLLPWLEQLQAQQLEALQYEYTPLAQIQGWSEIPRNQPLFESILVFNNYFVDSSRAKLSESLRASNYRSFEKTNYSLTVVALPGSELRLEITYNTHHFDAAAIARMLGHLKTLLVGMVANPYQHLRDLPLLTAAEQHQLLFEWNDTQTDYPKNQCIHELFEAQVEQSPDAIAVVFEDQHLTYRELNARANQLAHYLQSLGVRPEVLVGICVERSLEMIIGLLGILKAGGAYVPFDPEYPQQRLAFMGEDSQVPVLLTQEKFKEILPYHPAQVICLDSNWITIAQERQDNPVAGTHPDNLAYVIYTSGSTGTPKGAMNTHAGVCNRLLWMQEVYRLTAADRVLHKTPFSFDVSVWEFFWTLLTGACLVIAQPGGHRDSAYLVDLINQEQITTLHFVPSMLRIFLEELRSSDRENSPLSSQPLVPSLKRVICSGEALPFDLPERFFARLDAELHNLYGPTEAAIDVTAWACQRDRESTEPIVPIGSPIANIQIYLLDAELRLVPIGIPGELYIGGVALARGYLNRPELTTERFIPNPFSDKPGERLYRTGDIARYRSDGSIEYLGRSDHQVKVRGFRIELGEIEAVLSQHPAVREAIVLAREDVQGNKRLVAYVLASQLNPKLQDLRQFLSERLPEYMVPSIFVQLDAIPLTPNGKADRKALPEPNTTRPELDHAFVAPRTPIEAKLVEIWAEILRVERVSIHDNFFELGGDSILSLQIVAKANQAGLKLTPKELFKHPTIAELAAMTLTTERLQAEQGLVTGLVPLTPIQHWFFEQNLPEPHHFNQAVLLEAKQMLDPALLEQAVRQLLLHHDALRLRFEQTESGWQQHLASPDAEIPLTCMDYSLLAETEQRLAIEATATKLQASLNLSAGPLMRVVLFNLGRSAPCRLLVVIHHLVVDGVSWRILLEDLQTAYQQLSRGGTIKLPSKTTSFKHWSERLQEYAHSAELQEERNYWLRQFERQGRTCLPVDYPGGDNTVASAQQISISLSAEQTQALLQQVPKAYNTQINEVLLAALVQAFAQWTGNRALLVNVEGHGREEIFEDVDLSRTVGWFTTLFPVLLHLGEASDLGAVLKVVKEQLRGIPNRGIGYGVLRYLKDDQEIRETLALFQAEVIFNYLGQFDPMLSASSLFGLARESSGATRSPRGKRSHLLEINGLVSRGQLRLLWTYSKNLYRRATVERLAQQFVEALGSLITSCQSPEAKRYTPSDFPLAKLDQQELEGLIAQQQQVEDIYPLSPLQQGLLFHTLSAPGSGIYVSQVSFTLHGNLSVSVLKQTWQLIVARHPIFRTAFVWESLEQPLQVVHQQVHLPWQQHDWRELSSVEQQAKLESLLEGDRKESFILSQSPLMRLTLLQLAEDTYQFIWSFHHLLLDGWSIPLVFQDLFAVYAATSQGQNISLPPSRPYRDYIAWLEQQNLSSAEAFWQQLLKGFAAPTPLGTNRATKTGTDAERRYDTQTIEISAATTAALQSFTQQHQLTLNTLIQGSWALLLNHYSGEPDVVFGATSSGRPPHLTGAEFMVGLFINTLPVRVQISPQAFLILWLEQIQAQQIEARQYEYSPLVQVQKWSDISQGMSLFESVVIFENYPINSSLQKQNNNLEIRNVRFAINNGYPLTLRAVPKKELSLQILYDCCCFDADTITQRLRQLKALLSKIVSAPNVRLSELAELLAEADQQQQLIKARELEKASRQNFNIAKRKAIRGA
ncbi:MAG TPA: non-ribosomal peptide synthetase [Cyanobacteria bacterium UBA8803]|nr:non-ribosomal peptide synthetase [Cyanobacteria bacterium UBA8803]